MNLSQIHNVYFIGIGGIGMSALARYFKSLGKNVSGYDKTPSTLTHELIQSGIAIHFEEDITFLPNHFTKNNTLIIITPAVPKNHLEWNYFIENNYEIKKRAEVLGLITAETECLAVAGTHGKTTTSSILGHILYESGADATSFLGGIAEQYNTNLIGNGKRISVVEADEFDRSFLHLHPNIACITSMDADHLDIYGDAIAIQESFVQFANKIKDKSKLFITNGMPLDGITVGINDNSQIVAKNIKIEDGWYKFDIKTPSENIDNIRFGLPGKHNITNALMAFAMAKELGIPSTNIVKALASFKGVKRRFSFQIRKPDFVYIDDYAHHPTEINAVYQAIKELYPEQKNVVVFQPHLFSRTRDFGDAFAESLSQFDEVYLLDIYPARELPIEGITSKWLLDKMDNNNKKLIQKEELIATLQSSPAKVVITLGAGDIGELVNNIKNALEAIH